MPYKALILSLCFLVYVLEWATAPHWLTASVEKASCATNCCTNSPDKPCSKKPAGKSCNSMADCCLYCPLCTVTLLPAAPETQPIPVIKTNYAEYRSSYGYLYYSSAWKPPNKA